MTITASKPIPAKYQTYGIKDGWEPTPLQKQRLWLSGRSGIGKTTFVASNPEAIILDTENTVCDVWSAKARYLHATSMVEYIKFKDDLCKDGRAGKHPFQHVVIDTIDKFLELSIKYLTDKYNSSHRDKIVSITEAYGGKGGWYRIRDFMTTFLMDLALAGYGWTVVGNQVTKRHVDTSGKVTTEVSNVLPPSFVGALTRDAQLIMDLTKSTRRKTDPSTKRKFDETKYWLQIARNPVEGEVSNLPDTKARYLQFFPPDDIEVSLGRGHEIFSKIYDLAIDKARAST